MIKWEEWNEDLVLIGHAPGRKIEVMNNPCDGVTFVSFEELDSSRDTGDARLGTVRLQLGIGSEAEDRIIKTLCEAVIEEQDRFDREGT